MTSHYLSPHGTPAKNSGNNDSPLPIAIIGIGCRFPAASGPDEFWEMTCRGTDAISEVPPERFDVAAFYDPQPATPGKIVSRWGGFVDNVDAFDAAFFGISPREAARMDPQQRLLLEVAWEALEDAGQVPAKLAGSRTAVFIGQHTSDYWDLQRRGADVDIYAATGSAERSISSGRLSFAFDLRGPSVSVDTACSSSLVAVHLASQSLRAGESPLALAGGVNIILSPDAAITYSQARMLAHDGRCKFADAAADGFVRSEGAGVVVLKPLADAVADGDLIYAVILGSTTNNDGQGSGYLMAPATSGQQEMLRSAYQRAGIEPASVDYLEAHGTGTPVGDPVELQAAAAVLGEGRPGQTPCLIGSVKTNIGHLEAAAGIAGLIKAALCLKHRAVPPNLHVREPTVAIDWDQSPFLLPRELTPLPDRGRPAIAGVNSFGISGTNAHVILGEAPGAPIQNAPEPGGRANLLTLSARGPEALADLVRSYRDYLAPGGPGRRHALRDICHSAATRRAHHESRVTIVGTSHDDVAARLGEFLAGEQSRQVTVAHDVVGTPPRVAFVFPGQGSQWPGMGRELLESCPVFAETMQECDAAIGRETGWSVIAQLTGAAPERIDQLDVIQPTLFAIQVALAATWRSWGVEPGIVIGHSMGEAAAAYVAGVLDITDAAAVICRRSRLAGQRSGRGAMAVVELSVDEATKALAGHTDRVAVAASNSPASTVLSGDPEAIAGILNVLESGGVFCRRIDVDFASHSPQMDALCDDLINSLADLRPRPGTIPIHSTVLDARMDGVGFDARYWARNLREPVMFAPAVRSVADECETVFVEISPHPVLTGPIQDCLQAYELPGITACSLRRGEPEHASLLATLGTLHSLDHPIRWDAVHPRPAPFVRLPSYPWQRERCWIDADAAAGPDMAPARQAAARSLAAQSPRMRHPLLGDRVEDDAATGRYAWENHLDRLVNGYLDDHRVDGAVILPGAACVEIIAAAATEVFGSDRSLTIAGIEYAAPLFLRDGNRPWLRVTFATETAARWRFAIGSRRAEPGSGDQSWTVHAMGTLRLDVKRGDDDPADESLAKVRARCTEHVTREEFYGWLGPSGNQRGERFQAIAELWRGDHEAVARIRCPMPLEPELERYCFHPALLDACAQALAATVQIDPATTVNEDVFILGGIAEARIVRTPGKNLWSYARRIDSNQADCVVGDVVIMDANGDVAAELRGLRLQYLMRECNRPPAAVPQAGEPGDVGAWMYELGWRRLDWGRGELPVGAAWLLLADSSGVANRLREQLESAGQQCVTVAAGWSYARLGAARYRVNPGSQSDMRRVLTDGLADLGSAGWHGVVHMWNLDAVAAGQASGDAVAIAELLGCRSAVALVQALSAMRGPARPRLWLISQGAQAVAESDPVTPLQSPVWGLGRVIAREHPELHCALVDLDATHDPVRCAAIVGRQLCSTDDEDQVAIRGNGRFAARLVHHRATTSPAVDHERARVSPARVSVSTPGLLRDLVLQPAARTRPGPGEVEIATQFAALNYRDVLMSLGLYPEQDAGSPPLGWECSGRISALGEGVAGFSLGDEVIALATASMGTHVIAKASLVFPKPAGLSPAEAATIPVAFLTAYYSLCTLGGLTAGDRVLVHSATGGVGLAAVQIARWKGAEVFATAGSPEKRAALDALGVRHVADSRSLDFATSVREATAGHGVDVVLNTLTGEAIEANISLLAPHGRYLELTGRQAPGERQAELLPSARNLSFYRVDVADMIRHQPQRAAAALREVLDLVGAGTLGPLPHRGFAASDAAVAFLHMAQARHMGKILLSFESLPDTAASTGGPARPPIEIRPDATYLITGGLGGLGVAVARWLVQRSARHLLLIGRSELPARDAWGSGGPGSEKSERILALRELERSGATVTYAALDVADERRMRKAVQRYLAEGGPPIRGVIHAAGAFRYEFIADSGPPGLGEVLGPKVTGAWTLHRLFDRADLDFFLLFSSSASLLGSPALAGYAAGNAFLDGLAWHRRRSGQPGTCVNWGIWSSIGMAARFERSHGLSLVPQGMRSFTAEEGIAALEAVLAHDATQVMVLPADWHVWGRAHPKAAACPLLRELTPAVPAHTGGTARGGIGRNNGAAPAPAAISGGAAGAAPTAVATATVNPTTPVAAQAAVARAPAAASPPVTGGTTTAAGMIGHIVRPVPGGGSTTPAGFGASSGERGEREAVVGYLTGQVASVLGLPAKRLNGRLPLNRQGLDSLMAVEVRNRIQQDLGITLPVGKLLAGSTLEEVIGEALALLPAGEFPDTQHVPCPN